MTAALSDYAYAGRERHQVKARSDAAHAATPLKPVAAFRQLAATRATMERFRAPLAKLGMYFGNKDKVKYAA